MGLTQANPLNSQNMWLSDLMPHEHLSLASIYVSSERWITCFLEASRKSSCFLHPFELYITYFIMFWGTYFSFVLIGKIKTTMQEREQHGQLELPSSFCAWCSCICNESFTRCFQMLQDDSRKGGKRHEAMQGLCLRDLILCRKPLQECLKLTTLLQHFDIDSETLFP